MPLPKIYGQKQFHGQEGHQQRSCMLIQLKRLDHEPDVTSISIKVRAFSH
jgi:hypothetical protein